MPWWNRREVKADHSVMLSAFAGCLHLRFQIDLVFGVNWLSLTLYSCGTNSFVHLTCTGVHPLFAMLVPVRVLLYWSTVLGTVVPDTRVQFESLYFLMCTTSFVIFLAKHYHTYMHDGIRNWAVGSPSIPRIYAYDIGHTLRGARSYYYKYDTRYTRH